jgi:hypothetical protein
LRLAVLGIIFLIFVSVFAFFYAKYARMIDARLRGDIVVRTTGIYASPRIIRVSQAMTLPSLKSQKTRIRTADATLSKAT